MAAPTLVQVAKSTFSDSGLTDETSASITWEAGDIILVFGAIANNEVANQLGLPARAGLTFSLLTSVNNNAATDDIQVFLWTATAAGAGSGTVVSVTSPFDGKVVLRSGIVVYVYRGSGGLGTPVTLDGSTAKTISVTRAGANSHVVMMMADWNQVGDVTVTATPTGTVDHAQAESGQADFFAVSFGDQGAAGGPTAYGITGHTGTVDMSGIAVEIKGSAGQSINVGQITETDTSQTLGKTKRKTLGQVTETNTAQAFTKRKSRVLGQALETDLAQTIASSKSKAVAQAIENDLAQAITRSKSKVLGQPQEVDTSQAFSTTKAKALGQAQETDEAFSISSGGNDISVGQAEEVDTAQPISVRKTKTLEQVLEINEAQAITVNRAFLLGQAQEINLAQTITSLKLREIGQAIETDLAQSMTLSGGAGIPNLHKMFIDLDTGHLVWRIS